MFECEKPSCGSHGSWQEFKSEEEAKSGRSNCSSHALLENSWANSTDGVEDLVHNVSITSILEFQEYVHDAEFIFWNGKKWDVIEEV